MRSQEESLLIQLGRFPIGRVLSLDVSASTILTFLREPHVLFVAWCPLATERATDVVPNRLAGRKWLR